VCSITLIGWVAWFIIWITGAEKVYCPICGGKTINHVPTKRINGEKAIQAQRALNGSDWLYIIILIIFVIVVIGAFAKH